MTHLLILVGEASNRIPNQIQNEYSEIEWRAINGMRNTLIHAYDNVSYDLVWRTVHQRLPGLIEQLDRILAEWDNP